MKKSFLFILFILMVLAVFSQDEKGASKIKTGWNFGALPAVTYNTDLGFQYGVVVNLYHYGDGSNYPQYNHNIYLEASQYTKGSAIYRICYDSEFLIPGMRVSSDLAYLPDDAFDFYGFNGYETRYNLEWENSDYYNDGAGSYKTRMYYKYRNYNFRFKTDLQFPVSGKSFRGLVGFNLQYYDISTVNVAKFNKGKEEEPYPTKLQEGAETLYDKYSEWGIISDDEANGGFIPLLKAGLVYDTRDNEPNPMRGIWTELFVFGAPSFLGSESGFAKVNFTHRQYFTIVKRDLSFAYRVAYQGKLFGEVPFYYQTQIETSRMKDQLGLGGSKTIRGINRNRVVADGFVYANAELRWKVVHFRWINQNFYVGLNGFADMGMTVQPVQNEVLTSYKNNPDYSDYFTGNPDRLHMSVGAGLRIAMNENFVVALDFGKALDTQDGNTGMYIGLDYLF
ncbi:MAG: BamA/TamA family outer membrane protein [Prolixibacteraceae bacterium]|nr:BamA/TamA family outer membrane protein [Prolixibacteraceae bacterium]